MRSLPLRLRAATAFALATAVVLAACCTLVYVLVGRDLDDSLDRHLQLRTKDLAALVTTRPGSLARLGPGESFAELLSSSGRVVDSTPTLAGKALLRPGQLQAAVRRQVFADVPSAPGLDEPARLLATPVERGGRSFVLVVGESRENRAETLRSLRRDLYIAGPTALVLATLLGYLLAGSGLRAAERMLRRTALERERAFADEVDLRREPVAARELFESVGSRFLSRANEAERAIEIADPDRLRFEADRLTLEQALGSLVDNALRHGAGPVRLQAMRVRDSVELHVRDEGPGFPEDVLPHAFERPGLAVVATIAEAHGGRAEARNFGPNGADVWISLPAR